MSGATYISGNIRPDNEAFKTLEHILFQLGITIAHGGTAEPFFYEASETEAWEQYHQQLALYESISNSTFHILFNDEPIDEVISSEILYAMLRNRPILMTGEPSFSDDLSPFVKNIIVRHMPEFHTITLPELELTEVDTILRQLKTTNYELSNSEQLLIKNRLKTYFRDLLDKAKNIHLEAVHSGVHPILEN